MFQFVGDIGQPLHCEDLDVGGNDIDVTYGDESTNLHHIWDTEIPQSISGGSSQSAALSWAQTLTTGMYSILVVALTTFFTLLLPLVPSLCTTRY